MAEFVIEKFKYTWKKEWTGSTQYNRDDVVFYNGSAWVCMESHISQDFYTDLNSSTTKWQKMSHGVEYRGIWQSNQEYEVASVVTYAGNVYVCTQQHQTSVFDSSKWSVWFSSTEFRNSWLPNTDYELNDVIKFGSSSFKCTYPHRSGSVFNPSYWSVESEGSSFKNQYTPGTTYVVNDVVVSGQSLLKCIIAHTASSSIDTAKWVVVSVGSQFKGNWSVTTSYSPGDIVKHGGNLYFAQNTSAGETPYLQSATWKLLSQGYKFKGEWNPLAQYVSGDVVRKGGNVFVSLSNNSNVFDSEHWKLIVTGFQWKGSWQVNTRYNQNEVVFYKGSSYSASVDHNSSYSTTPDSSPVWQLLLKGASTGLTQTGDISILADSTNGITATPVRASAPGQILTVAQNNSVEYTQWNDETNVRYVAPYGVDRPDYGLVPSQPWKTIRYACKMVESTVRIAPLTIRVANGFYSEIAPITVPANTSIVGGGTAFNQRSVSKSVRIAPAGPRSTYDQDYTKISSSISFLSELVSNIIQGIQVNRSPSNTATQFLTPISTAQFSNTATQLLSDVQTHISVKYSQYVPPGTTVPTPPPTTPGEPVLTTPRYAATDYMVACQGFFVNNYFLYKTAVRPTFVKPVAVTPPSPVPTVNPNRFYAVDLLALNENCWIMNDPTLFRVSVRNKFIGATSQQPTTPSVPPSTTVTPVKYNGLDLLVSNHEWFITDPFLYAVSSIKRMLNQRVFNMGVVIEGGGSTPPPAPTPVPKPSIPSKDNTVIIYGTQTIDNSTNSVNARSILDANREFIKNEFKAYLIRTYNSVSLTEDEINTVVDELVSSVILDFKYTSNFYTQTTAKYIKGLLIGSAGEDLFRLQNGSVLDSLTLQGVVGEYVGKTTLTANDRPSGGSFITFDPGFGPNDSKTWITSQPPVVRNVSMIGLGSTGVYANGGLHNGGAKTINIESVSILSDNGIGVWSTLGAKINAKNVNTEYTHISVLSELGGTIKAINSQSSYGNYGAIAVERSGIETPKFARVKSLLSTIACNVGFVGNNDQVLNLEFENSGEGFTTGEISFAGAGTGATATFEEFLNGSVSRVHADTHNTAVQVRTGYCAAETSNNTLVISDSALLPAQIEGSRVVIESGPGAGQFGYIYHYNYTTKTITVYQESTGEAGWDHVTPGTPLATLTTESRYSIEPRVTAADPQFSSTVVTMPQLYSVISATSGATVNNYSSVTVSSGSEPAVFNVFRNGNTYSVTLINGGAGYQANTQLVIPGNAVGGSSPQNDISVSVLQATEYGEITNFSYTGVANGVVTVMTTDSNTVLYSTDQLTWKTASMPVTGRWEAVASGNGKFVSVGYNTAVSAVSSNGSTWTQGSLPSNSWVSVTYGSGRFVTIVENGNSFSSSIDGITWQSGTLPISANWAEIVFGNGRFVAVSKNSEVVIGAYTTAFAFQTSSVGASDPISSVTYGQGKFVAITTTGKSYYSIDGVTWVVGGSFNNGSLWNNVRYGNGIFFAVGTNNPSGSNVCATSSDGIRWKISTLVESGFWNTVVYNGKNWLVVPSNPSARWLSVQAGSKYTGRAIVENSKVTKIKAWNPGSGYSTAPQISVYFPGVNLTYMSVVRDGVVGQPVFTNRGTGYRVSTTRANVTGNGIVSTDVIGSRLSLDAGNPVVGGVVRFLGIGKDYYITRVNRLVNNVEIEVFPPLRSTDQVSHGSSVNMFTDISECKLVSHLFDRVGSGSVLQTANGVAPAVNQDTVEVGSGRVFFTSFNGGVFNVGDVLSVDQHNNSVTMSAEALGIEIDNQLNLPSLRSQTGVAVNEVSNDISFGANSDTVVPTQRAIKAFVASSLTSSSASITDTELAVGDLNISNGEISSNGPITVTSPSVIMQQVSGSLLASMFYQSSKI